MELPAAGPGGPCRAEAAPDAGLPAGVELRRQLRRAQAEIERLRARAEGSEWLADRVERQQKELEQLGAQLAAVTGELGQVAARPLRARARRLAARVRGRLLRSFSRSPDMPAAAGAEMVLVVPSASMPEDSRYQTWIAAYDTIGERERALVRGRLDRLAVRPLVSIVFPVYKTPERYVRAAIDSVRRQVYGHWELCVVDDASGTAALARVLDEYEGADPRITVLRRSTNGHICAASNDALTRATGSWLALMDHDDVLSEMALALAVLTVEEHPSAGVLYSDEDHLREEGVRSSPYFKPDFDPLLLLGQNYFAHLCMLRRDLVEQVGGWRVGYEGAQDWDLVLRVTELLDPADVVHIPHLLYHWRDHPGSTAANLAAKPYAAEAGRRAVQDHLDRTGGRGTASLIGGKGFNRVDWTLPEPPPAVSVVLVPRQAARFVRCVDSVRLRSTYPSVEIVVVDDGFDHPPLRQFLAERGDDVTVVAVGGDPTDGALRNAGAGAASGDVIVFLHDDVEVVTDRWLEELVGLLLQPSVGAVGARLLYPDGTVEHAGIVLGIGKNVGHPGRRADRLEPGYFGRGMLAQSFSAVSGACLAVRREAFDAVGGFDEEHFAFAFGDVDLCLRLGEAGWRVAWTPRAELLHHEAVADGRLSGETEVRAARDIRQLHARWGARLESDPAYNPNLSLAHETYALAWPPRVHWRDGGPDASPTPDQPVPATTDEPEALDQPAPVS